MYVSIVNRSLVILAISICTSLVQAQGKKQSLIDLPSIVNSVFDENDPFNGVVLLAINGRVVAEQAFGYRDFETKGKLKTSDIFELASVSKQFTAYVILRLEQSGKLAFDDPIEKYITIPYKGISIRNLLNHTSGLPDYQAIMDRHWDKTKVADNDDIIEYLNRFAPPVLFQPGEKYDYSNTGYVLLASIAEKASGKDFTEILRNDVFKKLKMRSTDLRTPSQRRELPNFSYGHIKAQNGRYVKADSFPSSNYTIWLGNREGPGRISSTARDLLKWDRALYDPKFMTNKMKQEAFKPAKLNNGKLSMYGFGWDLGRDENLGAFVQHNGDNPGYKTHILRFIDADKTIVLLCNNAHERFEKLLEVLRNELIKL